MVCSFTGIQYLQEPVTPVLRYIYINIPSLFLFLFLDYPECTPRQEIGSLLNSHMPLIKLEDNVRVVQNPELNSESLLVNSKSLLL